jgi:hypothetical protein
LVATFSSRHTWAMKAIVLVNQAARCCSMWVTLICYEGNVTCNCEFATIYQSQSVPISCLLCLTKGFHYLDCECHWNTIIISRKCMKLSFRAFCLNIGTSQHILMKSGVRTLPRKRSGEFNLIYYWYCVTPASRET